jgi:hypothetical protein
MELRAETAIVALGGAVAVLGLVAAGLLIDDWHQRDLAAAGRECRVEIAEARGRIEQFRDLLALSHPAAGGQGPVAGVRR